MQLDKQNLIWIDLEMTGLDPDKERIIEIATIVTDKYLKYFSRRSCFSHSSIKRTSQ